MATNFPNNPVNNQQHTVGSTVYVYNSAKGYWDVNAASPTVESQPAGGGVTAYTLLANLPVSGELGDLAYVTENQRIYLWNGTTWFHVLTAETPNTAPFITEGPKFGYSLATDGTPTVITLNATDPEGAAITWNYTVTGGSVGNIATITSSNNTFTITPSTNTADAGEFELTFTASDGVHVANTAPAYFSLYFSYDWIFGTMPIESTIDNPVNPVPIAGETFNYVNTTTLSFGSSMKFGRPNELFVSAPGVANSTDTGAFFIYDTSTNPPTYIGYYAHTVASGTGQGANVGLTFDANDDFIVLGQDESSSGANARLKYVKRQPDGTWSVNSTKFLNYVNTITSNASVFSNNISGISLDENSNTLAFQNAAQDDLEVMTWDGSNWVSEGIVDAGQNNPMYVDLLDHYMVSTNSANSGPTVNLYVKDPVTGWAKDQSFTTENFLKGYIKLFRFNGDYYFVLVGGGNSAAAAGDYQIEIFSIDSNTHAITRLHAEDGVNQQSGSGPEVNTSGNLFNYNYADAYLADDELHVIVGEYLNTRYHYIRYNMTSLTRDREVYRSGSVLTSTQSSAACSVAFDPTTGKLAISDSRYSSAYGNAGRVWILR